MIKLIFTDFEPYLPNFGFKVSMNYKKDPPKKFSDKLIFFPKMQSSIVDRKTGNYFAIFSKFCTWYKILHS